MATFVFDSNIPIAFEKVNHLDILETLFSSDEFSNELIMGTVNLQECQQPLSSQIKQFKRCKEEKQKNEKLLTQIKDYFNAITPENETLHTRDDADFHFIMVGILSNPDFMVTNDRHLLWFFNKFKNKFGYTKIKGYNLAHFLDLIRRSFMRACTNKELLSTNLNVYHIDELPSLFKNMKRARCFAEASYSEKYLRRNQEIFGDYKDNALRIDW